MAYYKICPDCGAALDPDEICDCKKIPASAANTGEDKAETIEPDSALSVPETEAGCQALIASINCLLHQANRRQLRNIYHFVLHIV